MKDLILLYSLARFGGYWKFNLFLDFYALGNLSPPCCLVSSFCKMAVVSLVKAGNAPALFFFLMDASTNILRKDFPLYVPNFKKEIVIKFHCGPTNSAPGEIMKMITMTLSSCWNCKSHQVLKYLQTLL